MTSYINHAWQPYEDSSRVQNRYSVNISKSEVLLSYDSAFFIFARKWRFFSSGKFGHWRSYPPGVVNSSDAGFHRDCLEDGEVE